MSLDKINHYGIIGMGPVGSTIAAHLKKVGCRVSVLAIDKVKCAELNENDLTVSGVLSAKVRLAENYSDLKSFLAASPQVIIIATKSCDSNELLKNIKACNPAENIIFVACQNGLDVERRISDLFGMERTLRMVVNIGCKFAPARIPGSEVQVAFSYIHYLSQPHEVPSAIPQQIAAHLNSAGFVTQVRKDYQVEVMKKAILNSSMNTLSALTGLTMKAILDDAELHFLIEEMVREGILVAQAMGLEVPREFLNEAIVYMAGGGDHKPSMLTDIENKRRTENEDHCGRILYYSRKYGVSVPSIQTVYSLMKNLERKVCL